MNNTKKLLGLVTIIATSFLFITGCDLINGNIDNNGNNNNPNSTYEGFLGRGYDIINSRYWHSDDVRPQILDTNKMLADGLIFIDNHLHRSTETSSIVGETISSFMNNLAVDVGLEVKGLFGAGLQSNFGIRMSDNLETTNSFAQSSTVLIKRRDFVGTVSHSNIRNNYILPTFRDEWLLNNDKTPAELITNFGTHIMLTVSLGGRIDMSYILNNEEGKSEMDIRAGLQASKGVVSGSVDMDLTVANNFRNSSRSEIIRTTGGSVGINMTSFENASNNYADWAESVENTDNLTLIRAGRLNLITEMLPIWELIDSNGPYAERREAIYTEFNHQLDILGITIDGLQRPGTTPVISYVRNVYMGISNQSRNAAITNMMSKVTSNSDDLRTLIVMEGEINRGTSARDWICMGFTTTINPNESIRNIVVRYGSGLPWEFTHNNILYNCNLMENANSGGSSTSIWIYTTKDPSAGEPLRDLLLEIRDEIDLSRIRTESGWSRVKVYNNGYTNDDANLNRGTSSSAPDIFFWMRK